MSNNAELLDEQLRAALGSAPSSAVPPPDGLATVEARGRRLRRRRHASLAACLLAAVAVLGLVMVPYGDRREDQLVTSPQETARTEPVEEGTSGPSLLSGPLATFPLSDTALPPLDKALVADGEYILTVTVSTEPRQEISLSLTNAGLPGVSGLTAETDRPLIWMVNGLNSEGTSEPKYPGRVVGVTRQEVAVVELDVPDGRTFRAPTLETTAAPTLRFFVIDLPSDLPSSALSSAAAGLRLTAVDEWGRTLLSWRRPGLGLPPTPNVDHWHAAYAIYLCDRFIPPSSNIQDPVGIHSHADGLIHIHPFDRNAGGDNATLGLFTKILGIGLSEQRLHVPGEGTFQSSETKCGTEAGRVQVVVDGRMITSTPQDVRLRNQSVITIAFVAPGTDIPPPPHAGDLQRLNPETEEVER